MSSWLLPAGIMLDVHAADLSAALSAAVPALAKLSGLDAALVATSRPESKAPVLKATSFLAVISLAGEKAVDAALVALLDGGFDEATILDAQSVCEAASREVPLFAAFQDVFGDPGGRRVILAWVSAEEGEQVTAIVRRACEDYKAVSGEVVLFPLASRWTWRPVDQAPPPRGH